MPPVMPTTRCLPFRSMPLFCPANAQKLVEDQQPGTADDRRVRQIERWPVPAAPVEVEEVDDMSVGDAVDHVADGAAQDQCERERKHALIPVACQQIEDEERRQDRNADQEDSL